MILHKLFQPIVENITIHPSGLTICSLKERKYTLGDWKFSTDTLNSLG